ARVVGGRDVVGVDRLEEQVPWHRDHGEAHPGEEATGDEGPGEEPTLLHGGGRLEGEGRPHPHDPEIPPGAFEAVEKALDVGLLPAVRRGGYTVGGPCLADR